MDQVKIGNIIAEKRKEKKLTQSELAEKLNISNRTIINWEKGKCLPDYSLLIPLCNNLDITINELLTGEKDSTKKTSEERIIEYLDRNRKQNIKEYQKLGKILLYGGIFLSLFSLLFLKPISPEIENMYPIIGMILATYGYSYINKKYTFKRRFKLNTLFFITFFLIIFGYDIIEVIFNNKIPRYQLTHISRFGISYIETPLYDAYYCYETDEEFNKEKFTIIPASLKLYEDTEEVIHQLKQKYCKEVGE